jgi:Mycothiol maleylpyruvate isomerase N-terminal domain
MTETGDRYRRRADAFAELITHTAPERWTSPSPCEGWLARDVVAHVVDYSAHVLREKAGMSEAPAFVGFDDPATAFGAIRRAVERVLDDPETPPDTANYLDLAVSFDLPQHGWDLAKATGQDPTMDPEEVELLWSSLSQAPKVWDWQRENGWYAAPSPFQTTPLSKTASSGSSAVTRAGRRADCERTELPICARSRRTECAHRTSPAQDCAAHISALMRS